MSIRFEVQELPLKIKKNQGLKLEYEVSFTDEDKKEPRAMRNSMKPVGKESQICLDLPPSCSKVHLRILENGDVEKSSRDIDIAELPNGEDATVFVEYEKDSKVQFFVSLSPTSGDPSNTLDENNRQRVPEIRQNYENQVTEREESHFIARKSMRCDLDVSSPKKSISAFVDQSTSPLKRLSEAEKTERDRNVHQEEMCIDKSRVEQLLKQCRESSVHLKAEHGALLFALKQNFRSKKALENSFSVGSFEITSKSKLGVTVTDRLLKIDPEKSETEKLFELQKKVSLMAKDHETKEDMHRKIMELEEQKKKLESGMKITEVNLEKVKLREETIRRELEDIKSSNTLCKKEVEASKAEVEKIKWEHQRQFEGQENNKNSKYKKDLTDMFEKDIWPELAPLYSKMAENGNITKENVRLDVSNCHTCAEICVKLRQLKGKFQTN